MKNNNLPEVQLRNCSFFPVGDRDHRFCYPERLSTFPLIPSAAPPLDPAEWLIVPAREAVQAIGKSAIMSIFSNSIIDNKTNIRMK